MMAQEIKESKSRVAPDRQRDAVTLHWLPLSRDLIRRWQRPTLLCVWTVAYGSLVRGSTPPLFPRGSDFLVPLKNFPARRLVAVMTPPCRELFPASVVQHVDGTAQKRTIKVLEPLKDSDHKVPPPPRSECATDLLNCVLPGTPLALVQVLHVQFELGEAELLNVEGVVGSAAERQHTLAH